MFDVTLILLYHAFKATTPFVDVNERLQQLLPSTNDFLLASSPWPHHVWKCGRHPICNGWD